MGMQTEVTDNGKEGDRIMKSKYTNYQAEHPGSLSAYANCPTLLKSSRSSFS